MIYKLNSHGIITPVSNYASVIANNNLKSSLVLSCAIHLLYFLLKIETGVLEQVTDVFQFPKAG